MRASLVMGRGMGLALRKWSMVIGMRVSGNVIRNMERGRKFVR